MPYKSDKQRKFFNVAANRAALEAEGVDVNEWNQSSKGLKLPATAPVKKRKKQAGLYEATAPIRAAGDGMRVGLGQPVLGNIHQSILSDLFAYAGPGGTKRLISDAAYVPTLGKRVFQHVRDRFTRQPEPAPAVPTGTLHQRDEFRRAKAGEAVKSAGPPPGVDGVLSGFFQGAPLKGLVGGLEESGLIDSPRELRAQAQSGSWLRPGYPKPRAVPSLQGVLTGVGFESARLGGPGRAPTLLREAATIPGKLHKKSSEEIMPGQLLDMDRDELLEKLAHMELRNRAVQRIKAALKLPGSGEAANLLSSWKGDLAGTMRAANPTLLDKIQTMARPHIDKATGWMDAHPTETLGIGGALGGAAIGGLSSLAGPRKKKRVLSNMLTGGLAGGALGLGGGALAQGLGLGESFGAMKGNISRAIEPVPKIKPQGKVQEIVAKKETLEGVNEVGEAIKKVNSPGAAAGGMFIDTAKAVGNAAVNTAESAPLTTSLTGAATLKGLHEAAGRKNVRDGKVNFLGRPGSGDLRNIHHGVSVNVAEDAQRAIAKAMKITDTKARDVAFERILNDATLDTPALRAEAVQRLQEQTAAVIAEQRAHLPSWWDPRPSSRQRVMSGADAMEAVQNSDIQLTAGAKPAPAPAPLPPAPPPPVSPILDAYGRPIPQPAPPAPRPAPAPPVGKTWSPHSQQNAMARAGAEAAPWLAHDIPWLAKHFPGLNNAYRRGFKILPGVGAAAAIIQEHRRIAALNAARQGGETLVQP